MRIIYLHQYFSTPSMPGGTRSYEMARRLVRAGHEVHVITTDQGRAESGWRLTEEAGVHVHWAGVPYANDMSYARRIWAFIQFAAVAAARATSLGGDLIFATSTPLTIALPAMIASWVRRIPMVFEVRDLWPEKPIAIGALRNPAAIALARALEWMAYHASRHIVVLSPGAVQGVISRGVDEQNVTVIPNACDIELFAVPDKSGRHVRDRLGISPDAALVVYTGAFGYVNGVSYLVELAAQQAAQHITFLLVGSGVERDEIVSLAQTRQVLGRNLYIWSPIPKDEVPGVLAAATLTTSLVISKQALWDNSANKFFDSLAAGKPIAINYGGWQAELLEKSGAGVVLPPDNPGEAASLLARCVGDKAWLEIAGRAARKLARDQFDRDDLASQLEVVLRNAAGGGQE